MIKIPKIIKVLKVLKRGDKWLYIYILLKILAPMKMSSLGHQKLIIWFSGHFSQYLMREGGIFFSFVKVLRNDAGSFFFLPCQNCDTQNNSRINYNLFLICFTGNYIAGYRDCSVDERLGLTLTVTMFTGFRRRSSALRLGRHFPTGNI